MLRFGFVEFAEEESARISLSLERTMLGSHAIRVVPSRSAIAPVDRRLLPRSAAERERCTRTVYCTNIQREVPAEEIIFFFESFCGKVLCLRVFDNRHYPTCAAFVEFATSESAVAALNCSGFVLGALPIRVNPSKTPIILGDFRSRI
ncbi:polyadenylate-binding protein-interacting protein 12 [Daucus carota subsp. sativus]|nr:PREDICTED: polyadenylate-binding protein-interacting protein 12-like [Daucus carota subsp. sativus]XP_017257506.1 PREDICTED: polyadenylate-binding protein-interacting protein 12-like [Daucus carota subsp. sativus]